MIGAESIVGFLAKTVLWGGLIIVFLALLAVTFFVMIGILRTMKYNYEVHIYEKVGDSFIVRRDAGMVDRTNGYFELLKAKVRLPRPKPDKVFSMQKMFSIKRVVCYHDFAGLLSPMSVGRGVRGLVSEFKKPTVMSADEKLLALGYPEGTNSAGLLPQEMGVNQRGPVDYQFNMDDLISVLRWREQEHQEALDTYREKQSFWERHQTVIALGAFMLVFVAFAFVMVWQLQHLNIEVNVGQTIR